MPQPVPYTRNYDFTSFQEDFPNQSLPAAPLDANLDAIGTSTGQIVGRLGQIQRDDGGLTNQIVTIDALSNDVRALLGSDLNPRGDWVTATVYEKLDMVNVNGITYLAVVDHTSGVFATDLAASKWILFSNPVSNSGSSFFQKFSGNGSATAFTLSDDLGTDEKALLVFYNDGTASKFQPLAPTAFTVNGTTLTITPAPVLATDNIFVFAPSSLLGAIAAAQAACAASEAAAATSAANALTSENNAATSATASSNSSKLQLNAKVDSYTLILTDANKLIEITKATAATLTVPPNASVAFELGTQIAVAQGGAGQVTIAPGAGVTILSKYSADKIEAQEGMVFLVKQATNIWRMVGDLV